MSRRRNTSEPESYNAGAVYCSRQRAMSLGNHREHAAQHGLFPRRRDRRVSVLLPNWRRLYSRCAVTVCPWRNLNQNLTLDEDPHPCLLTARASVWVSCFFTRMQAVPCGAGKTGPGDGDCIDCEAGKFKAGSGDADCTACAANSNSPAGSTAATACTCNPGHSGERESVCVRVCVCVCVCACVFAVID